ncbi:MAG: aquaporin [Microbacteriaceae bacterium]
MTGILRKATAEAIATLLFVFAIVAAINNAGDFAPLAIGFMLMVMVYTVGHISGGHLNPAVSFGAYVRGAINLAELIWYVSAQLVGGTLGALLSMIIFDRAASSLEIQVAPSFMVELIFTFVLVFVVLNVATSKDHPNNSFYGLAIGTTVFVGAVTVGGISGGGFNPAVALGLAVSGQFSWGNIWLYVLAPLVGALLAGIAFRVLNSHDLKKTS